MPRPPHRLCAALLCLAACGSLQLVSCARLPKNARGMTPIRFVLCDAHGQDCTIAARFETVRACERYQPFAAAHCEQTPGKLSCDLPPKPTTTSYCMP